MTVPGSINLSEKSWNLCTDPPPPACACRFTSLRQIIYGDICKDLSLVSSDQLVYKNKTELLNFHDQKPCRPHMQVLAASLEPRVHGAVNKSTYKEEVSTSCNSNWLCVNHLGCEVNIPECIRVRGICCQKACC